MISLRLKNCSIQAQTVGTETAMVFNYRFFDQTQRALSIVRERGFGHDDAGFIIRKLCLLEPLH